MKPRHLIVLCLLALIPGIASPQQKKQVKRQQTTVAAKPGKQATQTKQKAASASKTKQKASSSSKKQGKKSQQNTYTNDNIKGLQNQRAQIQKKIQEQEKLLKANKANVQQGLNNLMVINSEIDQHQRTIDGIQKDITDIDGNIQLLQTQLATLEQQLGQRKEKYIKSMRYMARRRSIQERLMFVFSADNLTQMFRRMRFMREYASYQRAQGEQLKEKQAQIASKHEELKKVKTEKNSLLWKDKKEHAALQEKQNEQQQVVTSLQKQQKTIQGIIDEQRKKDAELNAQIDRLVAEEVAKARARAAEEAKRKAAEAEAAKKKRAEELARKKAEAERVARENEQRVAEAKAREAEARAKAREAAKRADAAEKKKAEQAAKKAQAEREAAERKARVEKKRHDKEVAEAKKKDEETFTVSSVDRKLSSNFESNRGRLPMPITGGYRIVSHYGQYNVEGLKNVTLDNKGINILGQPGAQARAIFDGEVSAVYRYETNKLAVMVRHGRYISVYFNLRSANVHIGQKVSARQPLGPLSSENILQFQLRREMDRLNPEVWLGR